MQPRAFTNSHKFHVLFQKLPSVKTSKRFTLIKITTCSFNSFFALKVRISSVSWPSPSRNTKKASSKILNRTIRTTGSVSATMRYEEKIVTWSPTWFDYNPRGLILTQSLFSGWRIFHVFLVDLELVSAQRRRSWSFVLQSDRDLGQCHHPDGRRLLRRRRCRPLYRGNRFCLWRVEDAVQG